MDHMKFETLDLMAQNIEKIAALFPGCVMEGLDGIIPQYLQDKIWDMIWKRWCAYEDFCHTR